MDEEQILAAARGHFERVVGPESITAARTMGGPITLTDGREAWLIDVVAGRRHVLVSVAVGADGTLLLNHLHVGGRVRGA